MKTINSRGVMEEGSNLGGVLSKYWKRIACAGVGIGLSLGMIFSCNSNQKLLEKNQILVAKNLVLTSELDVQKRNYEDLEVALENFRILNKKGINVLQEDIGRLKQENPMRGLFSPLERLVGGIALFNESLVYTQRLDEIVQEVQSFPKNSSELWEDWQLREHGLHNYAPTLSWLLPPKIGDGEHTVVQQDFGKNIYIMVLGEGNHLGVDLTNQEGNGIYSSFDGFVVADRDDSGKGRTIWIEPYQQDEEGYFYHMGISHCNENTPRLKYGDKFKQGDFLGVVGNTGFSSGAHAHVETWRSKTKKSGTWEIFNLLANRTYAEGENIVWFTLKNIPESIRQIVRERVN